MAVMAVTVALGGAATARAQAPAELAAPDAAAGAAADTGARTQPEREQPERGQQERLARLYDELAVAPERQAARIAREIALEWSRSGSPAMDLLLRRGNDALEAGDTAAAIAHFSALTDHAPDFAEGWYRLALAHALAGLDGPAIDDLRRALALQPRHFDAIAGLGALAERTGKTALARRAYEAVLAIHPHHREAREGLERLRAESGGKDI
ncbi:MAG: tetratricopeptide repeat protein [Roseovarius sp.]